MRPSESQGDQDSGDEEKGSPAPKRCTELARAEKQEVALRQQEERRHYQTIEPHSATRPPLHHVAHCTEASARDSSAASAALSRIELNSPVVREMLYLLATPSKLAGRARGPRSCSSSSWLMASAILATSSATATGKPASDRTRAVAPLAAVRPRIGFR